MSLYCENQLINVIYPFRDEVGCLGPLFFRATRDHGAFCLTQVKVYAKGARGGFMRTSWLHRWYGDRYIGEMDEQTGPDVWTKVRVDINHGGDTFLTMSFYRKKAQVQGRMDNFCAQNVCAILREYMDSAGVRVPLMQPHMALAIFKGSTAIPVCRLNAPAISAQQENPLLPAGNVQRFPNDNLMEVAWDDVLVRLHANGTFTINFKKCTDGLDEKAQTIGQSVLKYVSDNLCAGVLAANRNYRGASTSRCAYHRLPDLDGKPYKGYTSRQLETLYSERIGSIPVPDSRVWKRRKKKLYMYLVMVGMCGPADINNFLR